ncbi:protein-associating with the carboxyl-terminal domain of ezrin-like [Acanthaster planci]|uniref:Protein-associating with the carboxyl-terminal domain of ezrin-like n=1 Tax=Acanthaster planci TaxID=133434 RepID=A0A8B7ZLH0_ACAPL|nr:protein-associating with the carboxyl-terminal domain of ezrin-like [Acanthaster planci]
MGTESSVLQGCKLEEPLATPSQSEWRLHPAKRKDGSRVSVFVHKKSEQEDRRLENAAKVEIPTILKFFASCDNVEGTYLITEQVRPLEIVLGSLTPEEICAGLYNIAEALSFLHDRGGASHNNVCLSSIYVSVQDGGWRLGGMEHLCKFEDATVQFLKQSKPLRNAQAIPPEEQEDSVSSTAPQFGHARDAYAFGILAQNMLEYLTDLGSMTANFEQRINDEFLNEEPTLRPRLSTLLHDQLFKNDFLEITNFLVHLTVKSEAAKNAFFEGLAPRLHRLPRELVANRLAPLLLSSFVMAEPMAVAMVLPHFMTPLRESNSKRREFLSDQINPLFPEDLYKQHVIPVVCKLFPSREMHVRLCLLQYFASYVDLFDVNLLKHVILPQLLIGLKDYHDELVSASLRGLAEMVPILGAHLVVGGERIKYFVEGRPKFLSKKESPLKNMDNVTNLTAVSGVITIPPLEKTPPTRASPSRVPDSGRASENEEEEVGGLAAKRREEERERRREEMRLKNEQRRKEREAKKAQSSGKVTLLSMANLNKDSLETIRHSQPEEVSPTSEETNSSECEERSEEGVILPEGDLDEANHQDKDDWSDWEDVDRADQSALSTSPDSVINQSGSLLLTSRERQEPVKAEPVETIPAVSGDAVVKPDWSRVQDDWSKADSDWTNANEKGHASSKKPSKSLQLKKQPVGKVSPEPKTEAKNPKSQPSTSKTVPKRPAKVPQSPISSELGSEFSIPDIILSQKQTSQEPDFFADMEPSFSFTASARAKDTKKGSNLKSARPAAYQTNQTSPIAHVEQPRSTSMAFNRGAVSAEPDDDGDGWGSDGDFDWDVES